MELEHRDDEMARRTGGERRSQAGHLAAGAVLGAALLAFIIQNAVAVELSWFVFSFSAPLWLLVLVVAAVTLGLAKVGGFFFRRARSKRHDRPDDER